ncbi:periodic tryptophan protein 2, partial [Lecanoromycetidae sp. Uapishka_2]
MKTEFKFSNLLGTVYCKGNLLFTPDGTCLLSPVGNRVTIFDLINISQNEIDFVTLNESGEWLAFGASKLGQLLVWEWQSESYILKQQGHFDSMNSIVYSPDGQRIITTADDGKIKVWDTQSGFCIVTFTEHSSGVTACEFAKRGNVLFTSSLDGSVRAWDLIRYRNFRTFTAPTRLSFSSVAVDPSGEVVCAGSLDSFDIHIWSVQTGQLLDQLAGHEGPVASLSFAPSGDTIVSGSWDHTVRIWSIFGRTQTSEPIQLQADVLHVAFRPDSKQIAVSTLDGQLTFWSVSESSQEAGVDGRRDVSGGRKISDRRTAANVAGTKSFNYGTQEFLNSRNLTEAGPIGLIDEQGEASDLEDRIDRTLPGATRGDLSIRRTRPEVRVPAVAFSPTGRSFCAASTEGLLVYSLDDVLQFDPFDLDIDITPATTLEAVKEQDYLRALVMAFRLNERPLIQSVYEAIPIANVLLTVKQLPTVYLARLLRFVTQATDESPHLEFNLRWIEALLSAHGPYLKDRASSFASELRSVQKAIAKIQSELARLADDNVYALDYLLSQPVTKAEVNGESNGLSRIMNGDGHDDDVMDEREEGEWMGLGDEDDGAVN